MEDYAYIIDYLPQGHQDGRKFRKEPVAYAVGTDQFKLFELIPKENVIINIGDKVYIGKDLSKRDKIVHVKRRIGYEHLTSSAQNELPYALVDVVLNQEYRFIRFFNESRPITNRFHMLDLLPGLGKKSMEAIVEERKKGPFKNFKDMVDRVKFLHQPEKLIAKRIEEELKDPKQKYMLFVQKMKEKEEE